MRNCIYCCKFDQDRMKNKNVIKVCRYQKRLLLAPPFLIFNEAL